jgi:RNA polymerase sigma-70 factor (family 1)
MQEVVVTDSELLRQMAAGDENGLKCLHERYWSKLYEYAVRKVTFQEVAEEIVQDVFLDLWKRRETLLVERLDAYLFGATKKRIIDVIRASLVRKHHEESSQLLRTSEDTGLDAEEELAYQELYSAIHKCLDLLPEKTSEIFRMNRMEQLSAREISTLLNIPARTVEYHITQGLRMMKVHLQDFLVLLFVIFQAG